MHELPKPILLPSFIQNFTQTDKEHTVLNVK